jgi:hypothetical protein
MGVFCGWVHVHGILEDELGLGGRDGERFKGRRFVLGQKL